MAETRPRFDSIAARTRSDIQAVLTPEQREQLSQHRMRGHDEGERP
jgi:Spy/CpxP family protein refolding chaperone